MLHLCISVFELFNTYLKMEVFTLFNKYLKMEVFTLFNTYLKMDVFTLFNTYRRWKFLPWVNTLPCCCSKICVTWSTLTINVCPCFQLTTPTFTDSYNRLCCQFLKYLRLNLIPEVLTVKRSFSLHKKWIFPLRISSVNVTKSAVSWKNLNGKLHFCFSVCGFSETLNDIVQTDSLLY